MANPHAIPTTLARANGRRAPNRDGPRRAKFHERRRLAERGPSGPLDEPRPGAPRKTTGGQVERAVTATLEAAPAGAAKRMARATGPSRTAACRIRRAFGLRPHRTEAFKPAEDPPFVEEVRDVVGLHMAPPDRALVPCVDEEPHGRRRPTSGHPGRVALAGTLRRPVPGAEPPDPPRVFPSVFPRPAACYNRPGAGLAQR